MSKNNVKRAAFIKQAISALEKTATSPEAEAKQAERAFNKLKYDFPAVSVPELDALAKVFRDSLRLKEGCTVYPLMVKVASNAVAGALQSIPSTQPQPQADAAFQLQRDSDAEAGDVQGAYHRLCAALLVAFMTKALSLPEDDAWALFDEYWPDLDEALASAQLEGAVEQLVGKPGPDLDQDRESASAPEHQETELATPSADGHLSIHKAAAVPEPEEAAQLDDDDCPYEAMELPANSQDPRSPAPASTTPSRWTDSLPTSTSHAPTQQLSPATDCRWSELCAKILHLGSQLSYSSISHSSVWQDPGTLTSLLELLRVLGIHSHAEQLRPLLHAYVMLLADRMCDAPADIAYLEQLMEALGVDALVASAPSTTAAVRRGRSPGLPVEAAAAFNLVAHLALHFGSAQGSLAASHSSARQTLWSQIQQHVVPLAALGLEDLCSSKAEELDLPAVALIAQVLLFYVRQRPAGVDAAKQLLTRGVVRSMSVLVPRCGGRGAAAEPLRLLALLCVACSLEVRRWLLAVPGFSSWLGAPEMQPGGSCEGHGAVWKLLAAEQQQQKKGEAQLDGCSGLVVLLGSTEVEQMPRLASTLKLMQEVHQVAGGGVTWGAAVQVRLRALVNELRSRAGAEAAARQEGAAAAGSSRAATVPGCGSSDAASAGSSSQERAGADEDASSLQQPSSARGQTAEDEDSGDEGDPKLHVDAAGLLKRRAKQLVPECIRIVKSLLTSGGKTD